MSWQCVCGKENPDYVMACMSGTCVMDREFVLSLSEAERGKYEAMTDGEREERKKHVAMTNGASRIAEKDGFLGWLKRLLGKTPQKV